MRELAYYEAKFEALDEIMAADSRVHLVNRLLLALLLISDLAIKILHFTVALGVTLADQLTFLFVVLDDVRPRGADGRNQRVVPTNLTRLPRRTPCKALNG